MTSDLAVISWICYQRHRQQKKIDKLDFMKIKNVRASKDFFTFKHSKKVTHRIGENICKSKRFACE